MTWCHLVPCCVTWGHVVSLGVTRCGVVSRGVVWWCGVVSRSVVWRCGVTWCGVVCAVHITRTNTRARATTWQHAYTPAALRGGPAGLAGCGRRGGAVIAVDKRGPIGTQSSGAHNRRERERERESEREREERERATRRERERAMRRERARDWNVNNTTSARTDRSSVLQTTEVK